MANETEYSNIQHVAAYLDAMIGPEFRDHTIMPALCHSVNLDEGNSDSKKLRVEGGFTAAQPSESNDAAVSEYTETSPATLTAVHTKVYGEMTYKAAKFSDIDTNRLLVKAAQAIATFVDETALALTPSFTTNVVGGPETALDPDTLSEAAYKLDAAKVFGTRAYILNPRPIQDIRSALVTTAGAASVFNSPQMLSVMSGLAPQANGFKGTYFDIPIFSTSSTADETVVGYDECWLGLCLSIEDAIALGFAGPVTFDIDKNIKKSVWQFAADLFFDAKIFRQTAGVKIRSAKA